VIILDTNVVSAMMRPSSDERVATWLDKTPRELLWLTSISIFEVRTGIELLPKGPKRRTLEQLFDHAVRVSLEGKVLPFDTAAATEAAALTARRKLSGYPSEWRDTQIAGVVLARKAQLATGNVRHFTDLGDAVINPWTT